MSAFVYVVVWIIAQLFMYEGKETNKEALSIILFMVGFFGGSLVLFIIVYYLWDWGAVVGIVLSLGTIVIGMALQ